jgi:hypothetical protein
MNLGQAVQDMPKAPFDALDTQRAGMYYEMNIGGSQL